MLPDDLPGVWLVRHHLAALPGGSTHTPRKHPPTQRPKRPTRPGTKAGAVAKPPHAQATPAPPQGDIPAGYKRPTRPAPTPPTKKESAVAKPPHAQATPAPPPGDIPSRYPLFTAARGKAGAAIMAGSEPDVRRNAKSVAHLMSDMDAELLLGTLCEAGVLAAWPGLSYVKDTDKKRGKLTHTTHHIPLGVYAEVVYPDPTGGRVLPATREKAAKSTNPATLLFAASVVPYVVGLVAEYHPQTPSLFADTGPEPEPEAERGAEVPAEGAAAGVLLTAREAAVVAGCTEGTWRKRWSRRQVPAPAAYNPQRWRREDVVACAD